MFQFLRVVFTLALYIAVMWAFMHFIRPYSDVAAHWLTDRMGWWAIALMFGVPFSLYLILKYFERPADYPPSRLNWLLRRRY